MKRFLFGAAALAAVMSASPAFAAPQVSNSASLSANVTNPTPSCPTGLQLQPVTGGQPGVHDGKVYTPYQLVDGSGNQIALDSTNVSSITESGPDGDNVNLAVDSNGPLLWFNVAHTNGDYTFAITPTSTGALQGCSNLNLTVPWQGHQDLLVAKWTTQAATAVVDQPFDVSAEFDLSNAVSGLVNQSSPLTGIEYVIEATDANNNKVDDSVVSITGGASGSPHFDNTTNEWTDNQGTLSDTTNPTYHVTVNQAGAYTITIYAIQN